MSAAPAASPCALHEEAGGWLAPLLLDWFNRHGRHDLPWQQPRTPYRVWLSEIMLQQTQVAVATAYFQRFAAALPDLPRLAAASEDQVLALWSGLGYYSRARNLHRAARQCMDQHGGNLPEGLDALLALPGIGRSTAGAILAQAHGRRSAILDGNVKRLLARLHGVAGWPGDAANARLLWQLSEGHLPHARLADYTQALMDFGATQCTRSRPVCGRCPLAARCVALRDGSVASLPGPRPRRPLPVRSTSMLLLVDRQQRVLLERRAPSGIWGGLWSLPEAEDADAALVRMAPLLADASAPTRLPAFTHVFTHFRLDVQPLCWRGIDPSPAGVADERPMRWCDASEIAQLGLPSPVRALLARSGWPQPTLGLAAAAV